MSLGAETIDCQACTPESREKDGCGRCGGYGHVLTQWVCPGCFRHAWVRPGVHTVFEGKTWWSFDGLQVKWENSESRCVKCLD